MFFKPDKELADLYQTWYENAMTRKRSYTFPYLGHAVQNGELACWSRDPENGALAGHRYGGYGGYGDIFMVSHFAPRNIKCGYELIMDAYASTNTKFMFAIPKDLMVQLYRFGFSIIANTTQIFDNQPSDKYVMVNVRQWKRKEEMLQLIKIRRYLNNTDNSLDSIMEDIRGKNIELTASVQLKKLSIVRSILSPRSRL